MELLPFFTKTRLRGYLLGFYSVLFLLLLSLSAVAQVLIPYQSTWKYAPESNNPPAATWINAEFDDSNWKSGQAPLGFSGQDGPSRNTTLISGENNKNYPVYYFRKSFTISNAETIRSLRLNANYDDGLVVYINGTQVASENMGQNPTPGEEAYYGYPVNSGNFITVSKTLNASLLQNGTNLIAVRLHQKGSASSDVYFDMELGSENPSITRFPYLQLPSYDQMTVRWYTDIPASTTVRYSTNTDFSNYQEYHSPTTDTLHSATLENLFYHTKYYYQVGYGSGDNFVALQNDPSVNYFNTLPPTYQKSEPMRFWLLGDSGAGQGTNPRPFYVRDAYLNYLETLGSPEPHSILFLGDNSNTFPFEGLQEALDTTIFRYYNRPFNNQPSVRHKQLLSHIPSWTVMGNHDYDPDYEFKDSTGTKVPLIKKAYYKQTAASFSTFSFPDSAQVGGEPTYNQKGYYSFDQGDVHFVVLNPYDIENPERKNEMWVEGNEIHSKNSISLDNKFNTSIDNLAQVRWLKNDLAKNTKKWTVVTFHQPPFSTIGHFSEPYPPYSNKTDADLIRVKEKLMPILEKPESKVDLIVVSHSHAYLRAGMIRVKDGQTRITDHQQTRNLGRYPTDAPYIKTGGEQAYSYILTGSSGRGVKRTVTGLDGNPVYVFDGGYDDGVKDQVRPVGASTPPLDDLKPDDTKFYHEMGGSVELLFRENRLDVKFIKETENGYSFTIADSFVVMKDVNKKTILTLQNGGDVAKLKASWVGNNYTWYSSESSQTPIASGVRELTLGPVKNTTYYVKDERGYLADTFIVNVVNPNDSPIGDTLISFNSQWLYPWGGQWTQSTDLSAQCNATWNYDSPPFESIGVGEIGFGTKNNNTSLVYRFERTALISSKIWFRRSFIVNGSPETYASFKLTLITYEANTNGSGVTYKSHLGGIYLNGAGANVINKSNVNLGNGKVAITYTLSNNGFRKGINYILVPFDISPGGSQYFIDPNQDPFAFDVQLLSVASQLAPPPSSKQFSFKRETIATRQVCAGDSLTVPFTALGNESGFPIVYEAQLVTANGSISLAEGPQSPIRVKIPTNVEEGTYRIKVVTKSAFMDQVELSEVKVKVLPGASITPGPIASIWKGQSYKLPITFTGSGPWDYSLSDGTKGRVFNADQGVEVSPVSPTTYTVRSVSNSCGVGTGTGSLQIDVKEPVVATRRVSGFTTAPQKTALCAGDSISISYSIIGPDANRTFVADLSDQQGSFASPLTLGTGTTNPLLVKLPASIQEGGAYRIRVKALNPDVDFTLGASEALSIRKTASGSFTVNKETIISNEEVTVNLNFTGSAPWYYFLRFGTDTLRGNVSVPSFQRIVSPKQTSIFSLDSVRNSCGYGIVSGSRTVTLTLLVNVDPVLNYGKSVFPNPTSDRLLLRNKQPWKGPVKWSIIETNGKILTHGSHLGTLSDIFEIDIHSLPPGSYLLQLVEGEQNSVWKIVKH